MNYLLMLRETGGKPETLTLPYEKSVLASLLGMTRESLSRVLPKLREHGVTVRGKDVVFQDVAKARALAKPDPLIDDPTG
jgi:CRP/FNR family transcriptional activator FtrB